MATPKKSTTKTKKSAVKSDFKPYTPRKGEAYMGTKQKNHFKKILLEQKSQLGADIDKTVHTMQDEATVFADPNDRASQESDMALELRNRDRERKLIKKINETERDKTCFNMC